MAADCRARGVPIVWVLVPRVGRPNDGADHRTLKKTAQAAGFSQIVDVTDAYDDFDPARLAVDPDDFHPNALGHERLARRLDAAIEWAARAAAALGPEPGSEPDRTIARCSQSSPQSALGVGCNATVVPALLASRRTTMTTPRTGAGGNGPNRHRATSLVLLALGPLSLARPTGTRSATWSTACALPSSTAPSATATPPATTKA